MSKKILLSLGLIFATAMTVSCAFAESTIYTDQLGRMHFMGKEGGYSGVRTMQMNQMQSSVVNDAVTQFSNSPKKEEVKQEVKEEVQTVDKKMSDVIEKTEQNTVPAKTHKATYTSEQRKMDPSSPYGYGATNLPVGGVNDTKTIYTDGLGRLHFFGKDNIIKE